MPVSAGLRAFFARMAANPGFRRAGSALIGKLGRTAKGSAAAYRKVEQTLRPTLTHPDKLGKLAFRTDVGMAGLGVGLTGWMARSQYKDDKHMKLMQSEREKALAQFKQMPSRRTKRVRRMGER